MTLGERLDGYKGVGPGFDHLRIGLAVTILFWHSFFVSYGSEWVTQLPPYILAGLAALLPMFFGLSGFLVMGSAFRTHNVRTFITFRILRILPALSVEVVLSALVLGPLVTSLPLIKYFTDAKFYSYFGILIGAIKWWLPGVFDKNPINTTNAALWTVGPEILCYCFVAGMMLSGFFIRKLPMVIGASVFLALCLLADHWELNWNVSRLPIKALVFSFMAGNIMYLYRHKIEYNAFLFFLALTTSIFSIVVAQNAAIFRPLYYVSAFALPYCSAYIGLTKLAPLPYFHRGDYSYGVYIYGFPIQQAIAFYFPHLRNWLFSFALAFPLSVAFATMSWHLIEKPALGVRKRFLPKAATLALDDEIDRFTVRKLIFLMLIVAYGLFVMNAARVFPLHELYDKILHHPYKAGETQQPV